MICGFANKEHIQELTEATEDLTSLHQAAGNGSTGIFLPVMPILKLVHCVLRSLIPLVN